MSVQVGEYEGPGIVGPVVRVEALYPVVCFSASSDWGDVHIDERQTGSNAELDGGDVCGVIIGRDAGHVQTPVCDAFPDQRGHSASLDALSSSPRPVLSHDVVSGKFKLVVGLQFGLLHHHDVRFVVV